MIYGLNAWNIDFVHHLFLPHVVGQSLNTPPPFDVIDADSRVWWLKPAGLYNVSSFDRLVLERVLDTAHLHTEGNWRALWKFKILPKANHFLWRLCRYGLPTRYNLNHRHVEVEETYPWCVSRDFFAYIHP